MHSSDQPLKTLHRHMHNTSQTFNPRVHIPPSHAPSSPSVRLSVRPLGVVFAVGLCQRLVIGFSARLPEMSDRWRPLVYIPCICCEPLIYLIRETCGSREKEREVRRWRAFYYECKT